MWLWYIACNLQKAEKACNLLKGIVYRKDVNRLVLTASYFWKNSMCTKDCLCLCARIRKTFAVRTTHLSTCATKGDLFSFFKSTVSWATLVITISMQSIATLKVKLYDNMLLSVALSSVRTELFYGSAFHHCMMVSIFTAWFPNSGCQPKPDRR